MVDTTWIDSVYWRQPYWLLLAFQPFILAAVRKLSNKSKLNRYADAALQAWVNWQPDIKKTNSRTSWLISRHTFYTLSWLLLAVALAGPRLLLEQPASTGMPVMNIMLVVDVSRSMHARDIAPDRLQRAQIEINELMQTAANIRLGIIVYTSRAHLLLPFTHDYEAVKYYTKLLNSLAMPTRGSRADNALSLAAKEITSAGFDTDSAVLWLSDGDFTEENSETLNAIKNSIATLNTAAIPLYILGMGTAEGDAIPDPESGWLEHQGRPVISRTDTALLKGFADSGKGRFIMAQNDDSDWQYLYSQGMASVSTTVINVSNQIDKDETLWKELYPWFLMPGIIFLFFSLMPLRLTSSSRQMLIPFAVFFLTISGQINDASALDIPEDLSRQAYQSYLSGHYQQSADHYHNLTGFKARLGEGSNYFRQAKYLQAITQFKQAVMLAADDQARGHAIYNLANATFMTGDYAAATVLYNDALLYRPLHVATQSNLNISQSLQLIIDQQMQQEMANRMGSGPNTARALQGLDINNQGSMAFDNEEERKKLVIPLPDIPEQELSLLVARGLAHIRLAQNGASPGNVIAADQQSHWTQETAAARLRMRELEDQQKFLWKRLFEMEEGFDAPLEEAELIPGTMPW